MRQCVRETGAKQQSNAYEAADAQIRRSSHITLSFAESSPHPVHVKREEIRSRWVHLACFCLFVQRRRRQAGGLESESGTVLTRSGKDEKKMRGKHAHFDASFPTAAVSR